MLLIYTAQRPGDVLEMTTARITEREERLYILLRQQKTDELLAVPLHNDLAPLVRERMATRIVRTVLEGDQKHAVASLLLVPSPTGLPWAYRNFSRAWDNRRKAAGIAGKQRRDLRRTEVALTAIELWEKAPPTESKVVDLGLTRKR